MMSTRRRGEKRCQRWRHAALPRILTCPARSLPSSPLCFLQEFHAQLKKLTDGDVSLVDKLGSVKLALQAAIANAFRTPEVIRMFAKREPAALRARLAALSEDRKLGRITEDRFKYALHAWLPAQAHSRPSCCMQGPSC